MRRRANRLRGISPHARRFGPHTQRARRRARWQRGPFVDRRRELDGRQRPGRVRDRRRVHERSTSRGREAAATGPGPTRRLVEADCVALPTQCPGRSFCKCVATTRDSSGEVNAEAFALGLDAYCDVLDRAGQCLISASEFRAAKPAARALVRRNASTRWKYVRRPPRARSTSKRAMPSAGRTRCAEPCCASSTSASPMASATTARSPSREILDARVSAAPGCRPSARLHARLHDRNHRLRKQLRSRARCLQQLLRRRTRARLLRARCRLSLCALSS